MLLPLYLLIPGILNIVILCIILFFLVKKYGSGLSFLRLIWSLIASQLWAEIFISFLKGSVIWNNTYIVGWVQVILFTIILRFFLIDFVKEKKNLNIILVTVVLVSFILSILSSFILYKMLFL